MANNSIKPVHPGHILKRQFIEPLSISNYRLAKASGLSQTLIGRIVAGKANITAEVALRLEGVFGMDAQTWLNLQNLYDLERLMKGKGRTLLRSTQRIDTQEQHISF